MSLKGDVLQQIQQKLGPLDPAGGGSSLYRFGHSVINVRTASQKSGNKYWFDVTPSYYEQGKVQFFIYACGSANNLYIFPTEEFADLMQGASLGGQKQVPNFTIYSDTQELEPAGKSTERRNVSRYFNNLTLIQEGFHE